MTLYDSHQHPRSVRVKIPLQKNVSTRTPCFQSERFLQPLRPERWDQRERKLGCPCSGSPGSHCARAPSKAQRWRAVCLKLFQTVNKKDMPEDWNEKEEEEEEYMLTWNTGFQPQRLQSIFRVNNMLLMLLLWSDWTLTSVQRHIDTYVVLHF